MAAVGATTSAACCQPPPRPAQPLRQLLRALWGMPCLGLPTNIQYFMLSPVLPLWRPLHAWQGAPLLGQCGSGQRGENLAPGFYNMLVGRRLARCPGHSSFGQGKCAGWWMGAELGVVFAWETV